MLSITLIIIILTVLISLQSFSNASMKERLIFHPYTIARENQYYRFLTHGFIHANWEHLLINMYVLYIFGEYLEAAFKRIFPSPFGPLVFLFVYLTAIVVSSLPSYFKHREDPYYGALGASGATSAMVFGFILFNPWEWFLFPPLPAILFGIAYL
jgi:membrane associated rhomboid family serine protease